jgi:hypothetical protein
LRDGYIEVKGDILLAVVTSFVNKAITKHLGVQIAGNLLKYVSKLHLLSKVLLPTDATNNLG